MIGVSKINRRGSKRIATSTIVPAPTQGIDTRQSLAKMGEQNAVYLFNVVCESLGITVRKGYKEFSVDIPSIDVENTYGVRTIVPFISSKNNASENRLFAVTNIGIYDITNGTPTIKFTFPVNIESAGFGIHCHYIDQGDHEFVFYADEMNGLHIYDKDADTWEVASDITGVNFDVGNVVFCVVHKLRLWLVERGTANAWYLPVASAKGEATKFSFGSKFDHGGFLKGLYNWTIDGGEGVDDFLVAISSTGDVLPYKGEDPSSADTWIGAGAYYVGGTPKGRRIAASYGGELHILSSFGITSMGNLLNGEAAKDKSAENVTKKIASLLRKHLSETSTEDGWEIIFAPTEGVYVINTPPRKTYPQTQYIMSLTTDSWSLWRGIPLMTMIEFDNKMYFGFGSAVHVLDGYRDKVLLDTSLPDASGVPIEFSIMTSFSQLGAQAQMKCVQLIRPDFVGAINIDYGAKAVYDYHITEPDIDIPPNYGTGDGAVWDSDMWDRGVWGGARENQETSRIVGGRGIGRSIAIALKGKTGEKITLVSIDVIWTTGGML